MKELLPLTLACHLPINCVCVRPVMCERSARDASNSANVVSIRPRAFLDGLPGFFAGSEVIASSVGVEAVVDSGMGVGVIGGL